MKTRTFLAASLLVLVSVGLAVHGAAPNKVADFMQLKLAHSQKLLEAVALEDYNAIAKNAQSLSLLCEDEQWKVFQTPDYMRHSDAFRHTANAIIAAADDKNLDGAALGYVSLTLQCVQCHKYVRDVRRADAGGPPVLLGQLR